MRLRRRENRIRRVCALAFSAKSWSRIGIVNVWRLPRHRPSRIPTDWRGRAAWQKGIEEEDATGLERHGQDAIGVDLFVADPPVAPPKHEKAAPRWLERYLAEGSPRLRHFAEITASLAGREP
jgi:hypothetical protein